MLLVQHRSTAVHANSAAPGEQESTRGATYRGIEALAVQEVDNVVQRLQQARIQRGAVLLQPAAHRGGGALRRAVRRLRCCSRPAGHLRGEGPAAWLATCNCVSSAAGRAWWGCKVNRRCRSRQALQRAGARAFHHRQHRLPGRARLAQAPASSCSCRSAGAGSPRSSQAYGQAAVDHEEVPREVP